MPQIHRGSSSTMTENCIHEPLSEEELRSLSVITPEDVLRLDKITDGTVALNFFS